MKLLSVYVLAACQPANTQCTQQPVNKKTEIVRVQKETDKESCQVTD
jgi:hypothetical protein